MQELVIKPIFLFKASLDSLMVSPGFFMGISVILASLVLLLSIAHYSIRKDYPILIGFFVFALSLADAVLLLKSRSLNLSVGLADQGLIASYFWSIVRLIEACGLLFLVTFILLWIISRENEDAILHALRIEAAVLGLMIAALYYILPYAWESAFSEITLLKMPWPWSLASAVLYGFAALFPLSDLLKKRPSYFVKALILASIMMAAGQSFIVIASYKSWAFPTGYPYFLQAFACLMLFLGLAIDLIVHSISDKKALLLLAETQQMLAERQRDLEKSNRELLDINEEIVQVNRKISLIIETAHDAFVSLDSEGLVTEWNKQAEVIFGWMREEAIGKKLNSVIIPLDKKHKLEEDIKRFFIGGEDPILNRQLEITALHKSGYDFPAEMSISVFRYQDSYYFNAFIRDITERKKSERELARRAEQLARSNEELEQFAYVASHDLQEPLRMVSSYTQLLAKRYQGKLDGDANDFIRFAVDGVSRMQRLINDLLEYSRVGTRERKMESLSLSEALKQALLNLQIAIKESAANISSDSLPQIRGDQTQMIQLFQNLISNAIKFKGDKPPRIQILLREEGKDYHITIKDNGIGFDAAYSKKIFVIFQRLHGAKEYPGTGIGLAICKKIVERHGGRIWVESEVGQGSAFHFILPKPKELLHDEVSGVALEMPKKS